VADDTVSTHEICVDAPRVRHIDPSKSTRANLHRRVGPTRATSRPVAETERASDGAGIRFRPCLIRVHLQFHDHAAFSWQGDVWGVVCLELRLVGVRSGPVRGTHIFQCRAFEKQIGTANRDIFPQQLRPRFGVLPSFASGDGGWYVAADVGGVSR